VIVLVQTWLFRKSAVYAFPIGGPTALTFCMNVERVLFEESNKLKKTLK